MLHMLSNSNVILELEVLQVGLELIQQYYNIHGSDESKVCPCRSNLRCYLTQKDLYLLKM